VAGTLLILPGAFAFTDLGYAGREVAQGGEGMLWKILFVLVLLAAVVLLPWFIRRFHK